MYCGSTFIGVAPASQHKSRTLAICCRCSLISLILTTLKQKTMQDFLACIRSICYNLSMKTCSVCGKPSGKYPICFTCNKLKNDGSVIKCDTCGVWRKASLFCAACGGKTVEKKEKDIEEKKVEKPVEKPKTKSKTDFCDKVIIGKDIVDSETKDVRKKWEAGHRCDDGHYVRSYSEMLIDNWLYHNKYVHAYEKKVFMETEPDEVVLSDFYLPQGEVYIEFWGKDDEKYNMRRERKLQLYKDNGYKVINIEPDEIKILGDVMPRKVFDYIKRR